ncbi:MAG: hemin-degrading factor [Rhizobiaceae bacterium]|nr:hemin-degrading factor [Rhizobiaceae bacterium]
MSKAARPNAAEIRKARQENPKLRERDLAQNLGISEGELVAAHCGEGVTRIRPQVVEILRGLEAVGEVMALTRNESAVHEKIGVFEKVVPGDHAVLTLGEHIDQRIFPNVWKHGFAVEKRDGDEVRRSLQFFDSAGEAVHKVHLRPASDLKAYEALVAAHVSDDQAQGLHVEAVAPETVEESQASAEELRDKWSKMTDVHQFFGLLRSLKLSRRQAMRMVGQDFAWSLDPQAVGAMMEGAAASGQPIMCFVGNRGCIQIHTGPISSIKTMGPWLNILDETFHLHLRTDHIREVWGVRKPTKDGHVTSVEAYDAQGQMIIQFFGKRHEGEGEREDWRGLVAGLPRIATQSAA